MTKKTAFRPIVVVVVRAFRFSFQSSDTSQTKPVDGLALYERAGDMESTTSTRNARRGESGAGAPAVRPQHVERREKSQLGELRRVSSESRAGGLADRKSNRSGEQTSMIEHLTFSVPRLRGGW